MLAAMGKQPAEIAAALSITGKTLKKHYSLELAKLAEAKLMLEGKLLMGLVREVDKGNVAANKELAKRLDKAGMQQMADRVANRGRDKPEKLGKKEAAKAAAADLTGKFAPPKPPANLIN